MALSRDQPRSPPLHRVGRMRFEIEGGDEAVLLRLRAGIAQGAGTWVPDALEAAFAPLDQPGRTLRVDRLEVDLGVLAREDGTSGMRRGLAEAVRRALEERLAGPSDVATARSGRRWEVPSERRTLGEALRVFLETGRLPWWSPAASLTALEAEIRQLGDRALGEIGRILAPALQRERPARRLVIQLEERAAAAIVASLPGASRRKSRRPAPLRDVPARPRRGVQAPDLAARVAAVRIAAGADAAQVRRASPATTGEGAGPAATREVSAAGREPRSEVEAATEADAEIVPAIPVTDAGSILIHPFLPALFEARGLVEAGRFVGEQARLRAVSLVACLAADDCPRSEPELVLPKLLSGWPLEEPVPRAPELEPADRDEAVELLRAVVGHWTALGNASVEALRETFLRRPGQLSRSGDAWRLEVERRGPDVLLSRLPWSLGPVALPWMEAPIHVDWI